MQSERLSKFVNRMAKRLGQTEDATTRSSTQPRPMTTIEEADVPDNWEILHDPRGRHPREYQLQAHADGGEGELQALIGVEKRDGLWYLDVLHEDAGEAAQGTILPRVIEPARYQTPEVAISEAVYYADNIEGEL